MITTEVGTTVTLIGMAHRKNQQGDRIIIPFDYTSINGIVHQSFDENLFEP